ncbi:50S ribosomal protein L3 [Patescibacteria group bacterium]|nr:50S ribosomal protein L3 [Patescibacteria group bacterium]
MTKLWIGDAHTAVTLLQIVPQEVVRYKTQEKDGYEAVVLAGGKKELQKTKGQKIQYDRMKEFPADETFKEKFAAGAPVDISLLEGVEKVSLTGTSKGKGFQGAVKRFHLAGGPKTHGSKFHRHVGSLGNRKPRRVQKGHPHAGHMGTDTVTLHNRPVAEILTVGEDKFIAVKGAVPGAYNTLLSLYIS